jgi:hypothetical protein
MKKRLWLLFSLVWLAIVASGSAVLMVYSYTPGQKDGSASKMWPTASHLSRGGDLPTLIMFAHPKCPCTRASISELAELMARCQGQVNAQVVFFRPAGVEKTWAQTDLWQSASVIPGVSVKEDEDGREARMFSAETSGRVVLYDAGGRLIFSGGITAARGHSGDNDGRSAIVELLAHRKPLKDSTPTFGCSIQGIVPEDSARKGS